MKWLALSILLVSFVALAEREFTQEYIELRAEVTKQLRGPYDECLAKEHRQQFEMALKECEAQGAGETVAGGCEHVAGYNQRYRDAVDYDCELLKPTIEQYTQALDKAVTERGIEQFKQEP